MIIVLFGLCIAAFLSFLIFKKTSKKQSIHYEEKPLIHLVEEGILILNSSLQGLQCNRNCCRILGCKTSDLVGKDFFSLEQGMNEIVLKKAQDLLKALAYTEQGQEESVRYNKGNEIISVEIRAVRLKEEYALMLKDTSDEHQTFKMGKDFIANASHELRTPITIIKGFIETLQDLPEVSDVMLEDIFEKILRSCTRMDDIVKNLLFLTDLDNGNKTHMQSIDMAALLDNCKHSLLEIYPDAAVEILSVKQIKKTEGDPSLLELAIMNLLQNAVKYSTAPAQIMIKLREENEECFISIIDRGCGISEENRPHIFNRFYSVNKTVSRRLGGAGLGLSIVKTIVEKHQGSIFVEDNPLGGTIFTLAIPNS